MYFTWYYIIEHGKEILLGGIMILTNNYINKSQEMKKGGYNQRDLK